MKFPHNTCWCNSTSARADARERRDDATWDRTKELIRHAVRTIMKEFGVTQEVALFWVNSALGITALGMRGKARP